MTKLTTELAAGTMPDMLLTTSLPVRQYEAKGLLRDLTPMLDADSTLSRDDLITEVLDARAVDGKLYRMPTSFMISAVAGRADIVGGYETWTLDDVQDAMKSSSRRDVSPSSIPKKASCPTASATIWTPLWTGKTASAVLTARNFGACSRLQTSSRWNVTTAALRTMRAIFPHEGRKAASYVPDVPRL